ncbi:MAG: hypothetical protein JWM11_4399, partial [Planctomycetaceae bacterium]|nr:hypothetical protein [Planctomycetaceae bacterium]
MRHSHCGWALARIATAQFAWLLAFAWPIQAADPLLKPAAKAKVRSGLQQLVAAKTAKKVPETKSETKAQPHIA